MAIHFEKEQYAALRQTYWASTTVFARAIWEHRLVAQHSIAIR